MQVVIPHARRSNELLARNLPFIRRNIEHRSIVVITDRENAGTLASLAGDDVELVDEDALQSGLSLEFVKKSFEGSVVPPRRAGWYFQQLLKMAWALRPECDEWYLVWDSDTFPLRPISLFDGEGTPLFTGSSEHNAVYFESIDALLGIRRQVEFSFIAENMLIRREYMLEMIAEIQGSKSAKGATFFEKIIRAALATSDPYRAFSEFECYGNFVAARHPGSYRRTYRSSSRKGARRFGLSPSRFDLARLARRFEIVSFERWDRIIPPIVAANKLISVLAHPFLRAKA